MRKCNCSGNCQPKEGYLTLREFIGFTGVGIGGTLLAGSTALASFELPPDELKQWEKEVTGPAQPRRYFSGKDTDVRMHLGGIGTGNFEIGADGQLAELALIMQRGLSLAWRRWRPTDLFHVCLAGGRILD